jgi:3-hydroxy-3-methylglutaryl CoA synthase/uncharacterized OB-fold protein
MNGIVAWGSYVPRARLDRRQLATMFKVSAPGGRRSVAGPDEDALTMGIEAARAALTDVGPETVESCWFATSHPPLLDRGNAASITAAVGLPDNVGSYDTGGSIRSGVATMRAAASQSAGSIAVLADMRFGRPGSDDETNGGDAATAFVFGPDAAVEIVAHASLSSPVMDRWRAEGDVGVSTWDDRWTAEHQVPLMVHVATDALKQAGITETDLAALVVSCPSARAEQQVVKSLGGSVVDSDPRADIGYCGTADVGLRTIAALDRLSAGQHLLVVTGADGADAMVLRATDRIVGVRTSNGVGPGTEIDAPTYLLWRGLVERAAVRRPPAEAPAAPAVARNEHWKFAFVGSECESCGTRHLPPQRVCLRCHATDRMSEVAMRDVPATVRTFTIDRLAQSLDPPVVVGVVDFDGGGRYRCQLTDVVADQVGVGDRVEMVYRLVSIAANGVRNYFWKARPIIEEQTS